MQHVRQVLQLLQQHKLQVTTLKLVFRQQYMNYLGFVADQEGIPPNPTKVQASAQGPASTSTLQLKSLMEGIHFDRNFVLHFSQSDHPLHHVANQPTLGWKPEADQHCTLLK